MHELAICQDVITQVEQIAQQHQAVTVARIELQVGPLSGVEVPLLEAAFPIACAGTVAEQAELAIEATPIRVKCQSCHEQSLVKANNLACRHCGDWHTQLVSGDEMILKRIEMDTEPSNV
ncbi:MAG: hydrogenase maturation nickel metallochaperone HypA [Chromatiales bacterium]|jgi:hydrogenase nickel incorporation protein HypA/HybF